MIKLYKILPIFFQNIIITIVNNYSYFQKFGAIPFFRPLKTVIWKNNAKLNDENVVERINKLIKDAIDNTEYYGRLKYDYLPLKTIDDIRKLPILKKEVLKKENNKFISKLSTSKNSYSFKTSGSTGTPLAGKVSLIDLRKRFLVVLASQKKEGIDYSQNVARFLGAQVADKKNVFRKDFINKHLLFSIYDISEKNIVKYYNALKENDIKIIEGYPSTIYSLVKLLKIKNLHLDSIIHIMTTAEQLLDFQKQEIESFFNCKIFDFYGSSEGSTYMFLSKEGYYTNANTIGFVEVVDENYEPVKMGELGKMLITSFSTSFTPLIRYDIGDYCSLLTPNYTSDPLKINEIGGRKEDVFITEEGVYFTRFSLCLKFLPNCIIESQLILTQKSKFVVLQYVCIGKDPEMSDFKIFEDKFESMLGEDYHFTYERIEKFEKAKRGKLRAVIVKNRHEEN